jgi:hypothetical protein
MLAGNEKDKATVLSRLWGITSQWEEFIFPTQQMGTMAGLLEISIPKGGGKYLLQDY